MGQVFASIMPALTLATMLSPSLACAGITGDVNFVITIEVPAREVESFSTWAWEHISELRGVVEHPINSDLFSVPAGLDVLEFGSEAARRYAHYTSTHVPEGAVFLELYLEASTAADLDRVKHTIATSFADYQQVKAGPVQDLSVEDYQKSVRGQLVDAGLWVGPPWDKPPPDCFSVFVEPGMAFGTGDHPTTQMCLQWLKREADSGRSFSSILDLGSGSGVLAVAARRLFPSARVVALEIDPNAESNFLRTCELNRVDASSIESFFGPAGDLRHWRKLHSEKMDLVISNIYAEVLAGLVPEVSAVSRLWVASGILEGKSEDEFCRAAERSFARHLRQSRTRDFSELDSSRGLNLGQEVWVLHEWRQRDS